MSEATIRSAIAGILADVTDIGKVHSYDRWAADWNSFISFFKATVDGKDQIRGWEIVRKAPIGDSKDDQGTLRTHTFVIRGYMAVKDADETEKTFNTLIEAVCAAFRDKKDLDGAALGTEYIQVDALETRSFGSVLCHFCEMSLTVYDLIN